jgi:hypothetical protein
MMDLYSLKEHRKWSSGIGESNDGKTEVLGGGGKYKGAMGSG